MCTTCGCSHSDVITITKIGDEANHEHIHLNPKDEEHHHHHHHDDHSHSHHHHQEVKPVTTLVELEMNILQKNNQMAAQNRGYFEGRQILALNLVSSPGSGKTSLLEATLRELRSEINCYVIEGDQQSANDAQRIAKANVPVVQINTGKACHLDAQMVQSAYRQLDPENHAILFVENVGNLVCPAMFDLGETARVVIISVTEGDDKPVKYPDMFHSSNICVINKTDLLPYVQFDVDKVKEYALRVNPDLVFFELSATSGEGLETWYDWLRHQLQKA